MDKMANQPSDLLQNEHAFGTYRCMIFIKSNPNPNLKASDVPKTHGTAWYAGVADSSESV